jgi:hypothetical protein
MIDPQADPAGDGIDEWPFPVQTWLCDAEKLTEPCDHCNLGSADREKAAEKKHEQHHANDGQSKRGPVESFHGALPLWS